MNPQDWTPDNGRISIFLTVDVKYYQHACVVMLSVLENNSGEPLDFYILTDKFVPGEGNKILNLQKTFPNCRIKFVTMDDSHFDGLPTKKWLTVQMYYRMMIPELFPELDRCLYFDSDVLVLGSLRELWNTDFEDNYCAASEDYATNRFNTALKERLGIAPEYTYICSGVLLMNLNKLREENKVPEFFETMRRIAPIQWWPDQDGINVTFMGKIKILDPKYGWCWHDSIERRKTGDYPPPVISHLTMRKPWREANWQKHESHDLYFYYLKKSPWRNRVWYYRISHSFLKTIRFPERVVSKWMKQLGLREFFRRKK
ncbi:glucosyltransferase [Planctomycetales bacterium]|nr:glucosyltransferase [Planctomycetales bacterium]